MKKLLIDCGNTRIKWGLRENGIWLARGNSGHGELEGLASTWQGLAPGCAIGSNVAGIGIGNGIEKILPGLKFEWIRARISQCGVRNGYEEPEKLGSDRWAALIAARKLLPEGGIVIGAGTALTVDILDDEGYFEGGYILPGLHAIMRSVMNSTRLEIHGGHFSSMPSNTEDAVYSGAILALTGAVEKISAMMQEPMCLIHGGDAALLLPHLEAKVEMKDNLVLEGLAEISENAP